MFWIGLLFRSTTETCASACLCVLSFRFAWAWSWYWKAVGHSMHARPTRQVYVIYVHLQRGNQACAIATTVWRMRGVSTKLLLICAIPAHAWILTVQTLVASTSLTSAGTPPFPMNWFLARMRLAHVSFCLVVRAVDRGLAFGLGEHASVAFFARVVMELMQLAAPADLVDRTLTKDQGVRDFLQVVASEERHHAELVWATVAWAIQAGKTSVQQAALSALDAAEAKLMKSVVFSEGNLDHGILSASLDLAVRREAASLVKRLPLELSSDNLWHKELSTFESLVYEAFDQSIIRLGDVQNEQVQQVVWCRNKICRISNQFVCSMKVQSHWEAWKHWAELQSTLETETPLWSTRVPLHPVRSIRAERYRDARTSEVAVHSNEGKENEDERSTAPGVYSWKGGFGLVVGRVVLEEVISTARAPQTL